MDLYGVLCTTLHKTPREVGQMRVPEVNRLMTYLNRRGGKSEAVALEPTLSPEDSRRLRDEFKQITGAR